MLYVTLKVTDPIYIDIDWYQKNILIWLFPISPRPSRQVHEPSPSILTLQGCEIELLLYCYKYFGILIDDWLSFKTHIENLVKRLRMKLWFFFCHRSCFSFAARKKLVTPFSLCLIMATFYIWMPLQTVCEVWILCITVPYGLSRVVEPSLTTALYMLELSGPLWRRAASCIGTLLFIKPS